MIRLSGVIAALLLAISAIWFGYLFTRRDLGQADGAGPAFTNASEPPATARNGALHQLLAKSYPDLRGKPQAMAQWSGKVLVVNFWATWCAPCREEMPGLSRLQLKYGPSGVQFVGIGIDDVDKIRQFQNDLPVSYVLLSAGFDTMALTAALGNGTQGLPFTVFVDRHGQLHAVKVGRLDESDVERRLGELL